MKQKFLLLAMMLCVMVSCTTEMDDYLSIPNETTLTQEEESIITRAMGCDTLEFSHLVDELDGDWILDEYGIRDWVESLTNKSIALATIANSYKIIGL